MIKNYIKFTFRTLWKNKGYSVINILGLSVGLTSFLIILLYLNYELSYDRWDPGLENVFKVSLRDTEDDISPNTQAPLAALLRENVSQIETATKISTDVSFEMPLSVEEKVISQSGVISADSLFFSVFPYKIIDGDGVNPLQKPNAMVISEEIAIKLFGQESPIGKTVKVFNSFDREVTAVMEHPHGPTHLNIQIVYRSPYETDNYHWQNWSFYTYIKTKNHISSEEVESAIDRIYYTDRLMKEKNITYEEFRKSEIREKLFVDAVHDIHNFPKYGNSNMANISILLVLASLLLFAGAINFSNLSIASSLKRAKEVGVKKVLGSSQAGLFWQFMGEIAIQCVIALNISFLLLHIALPYFNREFHIPLHLFGPSFSWSLLIQVLLCLIAVTIISGLYPAVFLARYNTTKVLKGDYSRGKQGQALRNGLIVIQFSVATFFIIGIIIVTRQLNYMQQFDKGFSGEQVLRIQALMMKTREDNFEQVRNNLLSITGVQAVAKTTKVPGDQFSDTSTMNFKYKGNLHRLGSVKVSKDYFGTLDINLIDGRLFTDSHPDQHTRSAIINETAAKKLGLQYAGGAYITYPDCDSIPMEIVGIVKDFNVLGLEQQIQPTVFTIGNDACMFQSGGAILVKLTGGDIGKQISAIEQLWKSIEPGFGIRYAFLDENFQQLFANHVRLQRIVFFFGLTAVAIAVIGLFALTAFLTGRRIKEISIRKILGANTVDLNFLLGKDFMRLITISVLVAVPLGWWAADIWLQNFAYRISLNGWLFTLAATSVLIIAACTIFINVLKVSRTNSAKNLRDD
ncbi:ABC transporter permease [Sphingobacterium sp. DN00404]|uniref:ABC transporter permease n=1 Tax=Sphingobacterium micropteri TaxID=2763501 RepID=A0ABR7YSJ2_9SPHI|nr:ABC transporter permease [Sphingobacterium micropteri]MBD1434161.1 ABC transporter permease [Sphingobacterium micropteri]